MSEAVGARESTYLKMVYASHGIFFEIYPMVKLASPGDRSWFLYPTSFNKEESLSTLASVTQAEMPS